MSETLGDMECSQVSTDEREELATYISTSLDGIFGQRDFGPAPQDFKLADALLAAGYAKQAAK